jgi:hypothetical protein
LAAEIVEAMPRSLQTEILHCCYCPLYPGSFRWLFAQSVGYKWIRDFGYEPELSFEWFFEQEPALVMQV